MDAENTGPSLALINGTVTLIEQDGTHHPTVHPQLFDTTDGLIAFVKDETEKVIEAYGSKQAVWERAAVASEQWGVEFPDSLAGWSLWHIAALTCE